MFLRSLTLLYFYEKEWHFNFKNEILKHADFASEWRKSRFRGLKI